MEKIGRILVFVGQKRKRKRKRKKKKGKKKEEERDFSCTPTSGCALICVSHASAGFLRVA